MGDMPRATRINHWFAGGALPAALILLSACASVTPLTVQNEETAWQSAFEKGENAMRAKDYKQAQAAYASAIEHARKLKTISPLHLAENLDSLGDVYLAEGDNKTAQSYYEQAVDKFTEIANSTTSSEMYKRMGVLLHAHALVSLGDIARLQGDLQKSGALYQKALQAEGAGIGCTPVSIDVAHGRVALGDTYHAKGDNEKALDYYQQALRTHGLGDITAAATRADIGRAMLKVADDFRDKKNYRKAADVYQLCMETAKGAESNPLVQEIKQHYAVYVSRSGCKDDPETFAQRTPEQDLF